MQNFSEHCKRSWGITKTCKLVSLLGLQIALLNGCATNLKEPASLIEVPSKIRIPSKYLTVCELSAAFENGEIRENYAEAYDCTVNKAQEFKEWLALKNLNIELAIQKVRDESNKK